ncbi:seryl-tRNA synthetase [Dehalogenimonas lykanthroporepellens BL-DC-9]|jgi:seryl-tRNA synthetase|nr:seryl-tRNA synthetase [Dehalogenimonas lykanthroporepellens BL-DC-9]
MLDLKLFRENPEVIKKAMNDRQAKAPIEEIITADDERKVISQSLDELRRQKKTLSKSGPIVPEKGRIVREKISELEERLRDIEGCLKDLLLQVPNIPQPSVPYGTGEADNVVRRYYGEKREFEFTPKSHWELGEQLDIIDFERGVKISGSRFYVLKNAGARLQRSLISLFLDIHTRQHGYSEMYLPFMVKQESLFGSGNLPKFADNLYRDANDDLWMVPTAEVPLTNLHRDEILASSELPKHYCAYTACFRREKMSAGKDTRGIKRGHQFDKVELYKFTTPESSNQELEKLLNDAEAIAKALELPYRIVELCTGDIGFASSKSYDIEIWAPGVGEWLEVSSCSNCLDFQARRANIRYRREDNNKVEYVHTLNGSGLALPRVVIAVLENYQESDGSITIPAALKPYMGTDRITV